MTKQHYFLIVGERDDAGFIQWTMDAETQININDAPIYNTETGEWESIGDNQEEDRAMVNDLLALFSGEYSEFSE